MKSFNQMFVILAIIPCLQIITCKPLFKGISLKKNYEMEISAIPFKHISFIKEKWLPFKMFSIKHDIAKRDVHLEEEAIDKNEKFPGLLTSVKRNLDLNSEGEILQNPAPVEESIESIHLSSNQIIGPKNVVDSVVHTSSIVPLSPNIIIAPSIKTMGSVLSPSAVLPITPELVIPIGPNEIEVVPLPPPNEFEVVPLPPPKEIEVVPLPPPPPPPPEHKEEMALDIQPIHTHVEVVPEVKPVESVSKLHTDISSAVPMNTLVAPPVVEEIVVPVSIDEPPKLEHIVEPPKVEAPIPEPPVEVPKFEPPVEPPVLEPTPGNKTGPPGLFMRGTRFVLYFGSVMLQLLSQMLSGAQPNLGQLTESLAL